MKARRTFLYVDEGSDAFVADCLERALTDAGGCVARVKAATLLTGDSWHDDADIIAFPGGADRPYANKLDGAGNASIRRFVEGGGRFLGVCAGAYYACSRIDFTGAEYAVKSPRELGFFPGTAIGSLPELASPYRTSDLNCASAARLHWAGGETHALYWGGCAFVADKDATGVSVLARYADLPADRDIAAVACQVGAGRAVLVGVHLETRGVDFDGERFSYPQGGENRPAAIARFLTLAEDSRRTLFDFLMEALLSAREGEAR